MSVTPPPLSPDSTHHSEPARPTVPPQLREPAHRACPRAIAYWTVEALIWLVIAGAGTWAIWWRWGSEHWWATALAALISVWLLVGVLIEPRLRYAVHRWEVAPIAVYTQSGWLSRERRIVPLSRVQTVDSKQGPLQRMFRLSTVVVTTASKAGSVEIAGLDSRDAERLVEELTRTTAATPGDAT